MAQSLQNQNRPEAPSPGSLFTLLRRCVLDSCVRVINWFTDSPAPESLPRALTNEPDARAEYMRTRMISVYKLPECVHHSLQYVLESSFDIKLIEQKLNRHIRDSLKMSATVTQFVTKTSGDAFSWAGPEAVRRKLSMFVFPSADHARELLRQMDDTPLQPRIRENIQANGFIVSYPRGKKLVDDAIVGPMARKAAHAAVDLLIKATIINDAQAHIGAELPASAFMLLVRASHEPWGVFDHKVWTNMVRLASHIRQTSPEISKEELGAILASFSTGPSPIESYESHKEALTKKLRARIEAIEAVKAEPERTGSLKSIDTQAGTSRESVAALLRDTKNLNLSASQISEHSRTLSALLRKSGIPDLQLIRQLLAHRYHPETIARELREQLRPEAPTVSASQRAAPLSDLVQLPRMPSSFLRFYKDANGRNDVTNWLQQQPSETQDLVNSKLQLIAQGGKGKGLTRGANETLRGICEWRIKTPKAVLRVYYLPAHRETGEITVLLIGHKDDQTEDLQEAQRRAETVKSQRATRLAGETPSDRAANS